MSQNNISPAARAANFKAVTRQNLQVMPAVKISEGGQFELTLPKSRFLARIFLKCDISYTNATSLTDDHKKTMMEKIHGVLNNITLNLNTGFKPYVVSGAALKILNSLYPDNGLAAYDNNITQTGARVCYEMPLTMSADSTAGLVLLQNHETTVNLSGEMVSLNSIFKGIGSFTGVSMTVTPMLETFTIPSSPDCYPSLSMLKLVNSRPETLVPSSENIIRMICGTTYRKVVLQFFDADGNPADLEDSAIISIVLNQADTPYAITAGMLKMWNYRAYNTALPAGCYVFDFSTADIAEHGGSRDLMDTERLTEFWIKVNTAADTVRCIVTTECLTRVTAG